MVSKYFWLNSQLNIGKIEKKKNRIEQICKETNVLRNTLVQLSHCALILPLDMVLEINGAHKSPDYCG